MKSIVIFLGVLSFIATAQAQLVSNKMMKIVTRDTSPDIQNTAFGAKPKTLYRVGETYGRSEEMPDPEQRIHGLMVIAEPKMWMINLFDKTGRLIVDPGPTFVFRASIIPPLDRNQKPPLEDFEFGTEYTFLRMNKATKEITTIGGTKYDRLSLSIAGFKIVLLSYAGQERPYRVTVFKDGTIICQYDYDEYKADMQARMELFTPPHDIRIDKTSGQ